MSNELDQAGENARGVLADVKGKRAALIEQIKPDTGNNGGSSGDTTSAAPTPTAADTATPSPARASGTATP